MKEFTIRQLAATRKSDQENDETLQEFFELTYPSVPADEINSIIRANRDNWDSVWVRKGGPNDDFEYSDQLLRKVNGDREKIASLIISGNPNSVIFMYDLKEYADDFSFTAHYSLENEKVIFILFFVLE